MTQELTVIENKLKEVTESVKMLMPTLVKVALSSMPKGSTESDAELVVIRELYNLHSVMATKPDLWNCTTASKIQALRDCISLNLSLAPSANLVYLYYSSIKYKPSPTSADVTEYVVTFDPTVNGELSMARQAGRIFDHETNIEYDNAGNVKTVSVRYLIPTVGGSRWDKPKVYGVGHFKKWKKASEKKNGGADKASPNYTSWNQDDDGKNGTIDPDFAETKAIIHSLKRRGTNMNEVSTLLNATIVNQPTIVKYDGTLKLSSNPEGEIIPASDSGGKMVILQETQITPAANDTPSNPVTIIDPNAM